MKLVSLVRALELSVFMDGLCIRANYLSLCYGSRDRDNGLIQRDRGTALVYGLAWRPLISLACLPSIALTHSEGAGERVIVSSIFWACHAWGAWS